MRARAIHRCIHVLDLEKSLAFYEKALGMTVVRRMGPEDHSWENVFIANPENGFQMELTWNDGRTEPYVNGGRDTHVCFAVDDIDAYRALHEEMGVVRFVNQTMGLYFIEDPDGCWIEIIADDNNNAGQPGVDVLAALRRRRSVRKYTGEAVSADQIEKIVEAGLLSAAGRGIRPWELVVVRNPETLTALAAMRAEGSARMLEGANAAIVVVARQEAADTWIEDCSICMANMHLEASALGLGSCWIQGRMRKADAEGASTEAYVAKLLGLPEGYVLEATLSLGVPAEQKDPAAVTDKLLAKVHYERF